MKQPTKINLNLIPNEKLDEIFNAMAMDMELAKQIERIDNNPNFTPEKKELFHKYRIQLAFEKYYLLKSTSSIKED